MNRQKISVYIITYNEEEKIKNCLESVKWADEIVIVDSYSTDRTIEICRKYTEKIFQHEFVGFGKLRNIALSYTSYDWVLSIDADERVTEELKKEIEEKLASGPEADAYFIPRKSHFLKYWIKHCGWYPDYRQPQFFNKHKMKYREQLVHEGFIVSGEVSYLKNHVLQYPFLTLNEFFKKMDRYSSLWAKEMIEKGKKIRFHHIFTHPIWTFLNMFIIKKGFLDGKIGLVLSVLYTYYTFIKYLKLWELTKRIVEVC